MASHIQVMMLLILSSCTISMSEREKKKDLMRPPSTGVSVEKSLLTPYFTEGEWPKNDWWESFHSPELNVLIEEGLLRNPTLMETYARLERAKQDSLYVRSALFPLVDFVGKNSKIFLSKNGLYRTLNPTLPLNGNLSELFFSLQYDFDIWGKNRQLYRAAVGKTVAAQADVAQVRLLLTVAIARVFFELKTDLNRQILLKNFVELQEKIFKLQGGLKVQSLASTLPVLVEEELYFSSKQVLEVVEEKVAIDQHLLNVLIGKGPDTPLGITSDLPCLPEALVIPSHIELDLVARRPDLMAKIWIAEALSHQVGAAIADFYPDFNLIAKGGEETFHVSNLLSAQSLNYTITPAIHLPIFTGGALKANVGRKKAEFEEAVFAYNQLLLTSVQEVTDALAKGKSIYQRRKNQQALVQSTKKRAELIAYKKKSGLNNILDLYIIQREVIHAELEDLDLLYGQYVASLELIKSLGGGYESSLQNPLLCYE